MIRGMRLREGCRNGECLLKLVIVVDWFEDETGLLIRSRF